MLTLTTSDRYLSVGAFRPKIQHDGILSIAENANIDDFNSFNSLENIEMEDIAPEASPLVIPNYSKSPSLFSSDTSYSGSIPHSPNVSSFTPEIPKTVICIGSVSLRAFSSALEHGQKAKKINLIASYQTKSLEIFTSSPKKSEYAGIVRKPGASDFVSVMQKHEIDIEAFVPDISKTQNGSTELWVAVDIFCSRDQSIAVGRSLCRNGLYLGDPYRLSIEGVDIADFKSPKKSGELIKLNNTELLEREDEISDLFTTSSNVKSDVGQLDIKVSEKIITTLKEHQWAGVLWMLSKEGTSAHQGQDVLKGGILADEMGMGKSLTTLSLIATSQELEAIGPTLIVSPRSVVNTWKEQIEIHTRNLKYLLYDPSEWKDTALRLENYDLVITTYGVLAYQNSKEGSEVMGMQWKRVILDEAHIIRERSTNTAKAMFRLSSSYRWCLTGTPVQNKLDDYGSLLEFLRYSPYDTRKHFHSSIIKPLRFRNEKALDKLKSLISDTTLRRLKERSHLGLPAREDYVRRLTFSENEMRFHKLLYTFTKSQIQKAVCSGAKGSGSGSYMTQLILRLRQVCNHGADLLPSALQLELEKVDAAGENYLDTMTTTFTKMICELCKSPCTSNISAINFFEDCQHSICSNCSQDDSNCPLCQKAHQEISINSNIKPSTKVRALIENLLTNPSVKSVVFSCWTKMLDLVEIALRREGIACTRIEGSLSRKERQERTEIFRTQESCRVFLATLGTGSVGLDLTVASHVHLLEPQFNPMLEEQALARVHRIGQTKPVITTRYIMQGSYEEQILKKQDKKLQLAELCVSGTPRFNGSTSKYLECLEAVIN